MIIHPGFVGIDISKAYLDIFDARLGRSERVVNDTANAAALAARFARAGDFVVFEATGAYDRALARALNQAGAVFARVNPAKARDFARCAGFLAKTDAVDARMLAAMGQALRPAPQAPADPARERLTALVRRRDQLVAMAAQERVRAKDEMDADLANDLRAHLAWLDTRIATLAHAIAVLIDAEFAAPARLLRSVPGIGPVACAALLALAPELGARSPKTIAALAGLAPINRDSGAHRGKRMIMGGRKRIRDALYMAALAAARSPTKLGDFYRSLRAAGKPAKLALVALARKLIVIANAVLRDKQPFQPA